VPAEPAVAYRRLVIGSGQVTLLDGQAVVADSRGPAVTEFSLRDTHRMVERACARARQHGARPETVAEIEELLRVLGRHLADAIPLPVMDELSAAVDAVQAEGGTLQLGFAVGDRHSALPWEAMLLPGATVPLALHPVVRPYRLAGTAMADPGHFLDFAAGGLDILALLANPLPADLDAVPTALLDLEAETRRLADVVNRLPARARLRTLGLGSLDNLARALADTPANIVHIASHARPGMLLLEDGAGRPAPESTERLIRAIGASAKPGIVVLAGCATAAGLERPAGDVGAGELPGLAQRLAEAGTPGVVAMSTPVSDAYAGRLIAAFYTELVSGATILDALQTARIELAQTGRADGAPRLPEWNAAVVFAGCTADPARTVPPPRSTAGGAATDSPATPLNVSEPLVTGLAMPLGEFVGRRALLRTTAHELSRNARAGLVVHGMGGGGKSAFLGELLRLFPADSTPVALLSGPVDTDQILAALAAALEPENHQPLADTRIPWRTRLATLSGPPPLLVLDGLEDNLVRRPEGDLAFRDEDVAAFLETWLTQVPGARTLATCRHPLPLSPAAAEAVTHLPLPALSDAETSLLRIRLPALRLLPHTTWRDAQQAIGGHPRTYGYLDALLRGGHTASPDLAERLNRLTAGTVQDVAARTGGRVRLAVDEASRLAAADVLLTDLLAGLDEPARAMLQRAAVFRKAVPADAFASDGDRGPLRTLEEAGLISADAGDDRWLVHRWTATELQRLDPEAEAAGHLPAALYWQERFEADEAPLGVKLVAAQEAMHHLVASGSKNQAVRVASRLCGRLHLTGMWGTEERICRELLTWMDPGTPDETMTHRQLGLIARDRGDFAAARVHLEQALTISEATDDTRGIAYAQHQLGSVESEQGLFDAAVARFECAAALFTDLGAERDAAASLFEMSTIDEDRDRLTEARQALLTAMAVFEKEGDRPALVACHQRLSSLAQSAGDLISARTHLDDAAAICEADGNHYAAIEVQQQLGTLLTQIGDHDAAYEAFDMVLTDAGKRAAPVEIARSHHHLGISAQARGEHVVAERHFRTALQLNQSLGRTAAEASNRTHLATLTRLAGSPLDGLAKARRALALYDGTDEVRGRGDVYLVIGDCLRDLGRIDEARQAYEAAVADHEGMGDVPATDAARRALATLSTGEETAPTY